MSRPEARARWSERLAGAPISWGVCEVPGWGHQLPAALVLAEMAAAGLRATEFGPDGFLPADGSGRRRVLASHGLSAVGGFVPVVAHTPGRDPLPGLDALLDAFVAAGAGTVVFAAVSGRDGYDVRPELTGEEWQALCANLDLLDAAVAARGLRAAVHPHVGTLVERPDEIERVLDATWIGLCLDTGHLLAGGADPLALARDAAGRIVHVHLKDVDAGAADRVRAGQIGYADAVRAGMYRPLGQGDARIAEVVRSLESAGYGGWYVLEQDLALASPGPGDGPAGADAAAAVRVDVDASLAHLRAVLGSGAATRDCA